MGDRGTAQLVMRREDGGSVLSGGPVTAGSLGSVELPQARVDEIARRVEALGFGVEAGDRTTLAISGPRERFASVFGLEVAPPAGVSAAHATRIPDELEPFVADVIVPPAPTTFP